MARKATPKVEKVEEEIIPSEALPVDETFYMPVVEEEVVEEVVVKEEPKPTTEKPVVVPVIIDNRAADRILSDLSARGNNVYEAAIITADKHYLQGSNIKYLVVLVIQLVKVGGTIKFPVSYFDSFEGAVQEGDFWKIVKE